MIQKRLCNLGVNSLLLLISCVLGGVILEGGIRIVFPVFDPRGRVEFQCVDGVARGPENVDLRQYTNTGEFDYQVAFNQYGFRDNKDVAQASPEDIFVVGDSFSFGQGVEKKYRYSDILDQALPINVLNISSPTNLDGYYWLLKYAESKAAPIQNVIIGLCMENDLGLYSSLIQKCSPVPAFSWQALFLGQTAITFQQLKGVLLKHFATYSLITAVVHQNDILRDFAIRLGLVYKNDAFPGLLHQLNEEALRSSADRVVDLTRHYQALVVIIPSRGLWQGNKRQEQQKIHEYFVGLLQERQLHVLDLRDVLERSGAPLSFHHRKEGHWNAKGHQTAAQEIQNYVKQSSVFGVFHP